ncbi:MAG: glycosyltransferase [Acidimicrobiales bacterium]|nr:glycosyltransferase [Acidimicrobiales bacterium]
MAEPGPNPAKPGRIRVLQLIKGLGPGGAEQLLVQHARKHDRGRFDYVVAYVVPEKNHLVPLLAEQGVPAVCLTPEPTFSTGTWPSTGTRAPAGAWIPRLRRLLIDTPFDVVHVHSPLLAATVRIMARALPPDRRPHVVATEHNRWPRHHPITRLANRATIGLDSRTFAVSDDVAATMPSASAVDVVVHGIDVARTEALAARRAEIRAEFGLSDDEVVIGTVANYRNEKAYDLLLDVAADVVGSRPNCRYLLVGQGPLEAAIIEQHERLGLGDRVILAGYRPDATAVTAAFDVFTMSSRHEGLPVALMDALALGRPVAATRAGGIPQAVRHDKEALLVDIDDAAGLADAHRALIDDRDLRRRLGDAARIRALSFDAERTTARLEGEYLTLCSA